MDQFNIFSTESLSNITKSKYNCFTSDGQFLIFIDQASRKAVKYSHSLELVEEFQISRVYTSICYDKKEQCFWGCCSEESSFIYKINTAFWEIDCFQHMNYHSCYGTVTAIAYDCREDDLILTYGHKVASVDKHSFTTKSIKFSDPKTTYKSCIQSEHRCVCVQTKNGSEFISISDHTQPVMQSCLPKEYKILSIVELCAEGKHYICILASKHNSYYYLMKGALCGFDKPDASNPVLPSDGEEPGNENDCDVCQECTDVIESIALEQTAIAHILNAEGEKIQKAVVIADNIQELLEVNHSVIQTVREIMHLEQVLCSKLKIACKTLKK